MENRRVYGSQQDLASNNDDVKIFTDFCNDADGKEGEFIDNYIKKKAFQKYKTHNLSMCEHLSTKFND